MRATREARNPNPNVPFTNAWAAVLSIRESSNTHLWNVKNVIFSRASRVIWTLDHVKLTHSSYFEVLQSWYSEVLTAAFTCVLGREKLWFFIVRVCILISLQLSCQSVTQFGLFCQSFTIEPHCSPRNKSTVFYQSSLKTQSYHGEISVNYHDLSRAKALCFFKQRSHRNLIGAVMVSLFPWHVC